MSIDAQANGHGTVAVSVTIDRSALSALGGETEFARQLSVSDLTAAGWKVSGPNPAGSGSEVTVSHAYSNGAEASRLLAEVAGTGPPSSRPFRIVVATHRGLLKVRTTLSGKVDLSCGTSCFGDPGLQAALGNPAGIAVAPLERSAGEPASKVLGFTVVANMPGTVRSDNAPTRTGSQLSWRPQLLATSPVTAVSESVNWGNVVLVCVIAGVAVAVGVTVLFLRRRRRPPSGGRKRAHAKRRRRRRGETRPDPEVVTAGS